MGGPGGMSTMRCGRLVFYIHVHQSFTLYFSGKGPSLLHPNEAQRSFFPLQSYSKKFLNTNWNVLVPPGHPIILLKFNLFNVAAISVKGAIAERQIYLILETGVFFLCVAFFVQGEKGEVGMPGQDGKAGIKVQ